MHADFTTTQASIKLQFDLGLNWECNKLCVTGKIGTMKIVSIFNI